MEQTMEANQVYEVYFKEITNKIDAQDYEKALALCNEVKIDYSQKALLIQFY